MSKVSISEAARLAGISRTHFYRKYVNNGIVSISRNNFGKPLIDISELLRVINKLHEHDVEVTSSDMDVTYKSYGSEVLLLEKIKWLEALLQSKEEELNSYRNREKKFYALLEYQTKKKRWWLLGR